MNATETKDREAGAVVCSTCGKELSGCGACDTEPCPAPSCYPCAAKELHETSLQPHQHGG